VALADALTAPYPEMFAHSVSQTTLLFPYTSYLSVITVVVAVVWLLHHRTRTTPPTTS
jgi:hypothetical protein